MHVSLVNLEGKTLDSFRDESAARAALRATVEADPGLADEVMLLVSGDDGQPVGDAIMFEDLGLVKVTASAGLFGLVMIGAASAAAGYKIIRDEDEPAAPAFGPAVPAC